MSKSKIDWCDETWNPIVGCKRGCGYCYARDLHNKRHEAFKRGRLQNMPQYTMSFDKIQFITSRLEKPCTTKKGKVIFVGSSSDPEYWNPVHFSKIIAVCKRHKQHTFMFLTKNVASYSLFDFPGNCMLGLTTTWEDWTVDHYALKKFCVDYKENRKFVSMEPLLGEYLPTSYINDLELVIVGAMTGFNSVIAQKKWISKIDANIPAEKILWKKNIEKYI